ncbi:MAG: zf-TFIIB domain-containing protein [Deltaproteobacteria bacterium]|nr:zf-TFIIB domain-containing protein [Deltaproteobacteria bacterium]MBI4223475.1 zf-TFIIB domain-containing protein [Deltaproteobacteria bacterium]
MTLEKPSSTEEEYFARMEAEKKKKSADAKRAQMSQTERERLKKEHWMRCPKCGLELQSIDYRGVTIDKCFHCGGIYLDDGELEKLAGQKSRLLQNIAELFKG